MIEQSRYRLEDGEACIDVRVGTFQHLFDNRDPAPFRERALDPGLSEYLVDSAEDLLGAGLKEGLVISSWVVMWRPVEILIYDWIPIRHERRVASKLLEAPIDVRVGSGPCDP